MRPRSDKARLIDLVKFNGTVVGSRRSTERKTNYYWLFLGSFRLRRGVIAFKRAMPQGRDLLRRIEFDLLSRRSRVASRVAVEIPASPKNIFFVSLSQTPCIACRGKWDVPLRSSYTSTWSPRAAAYSAARDPTGPAPTTTTFCRGEAAAIDTRYNQDAQFLSLEFANELTVTCCDIGRRSNNHPGSTGR